MRKFIFVSLFALSLCGDAWACVSEAPTHNSYVFSVFRRESMELPFSSGINSYWKNYAGDPSDNSPQYYNGIMTESTLWRAAAAMWPCRNICSCSTDT